MSVKVADTIVPMGAGGFPVVDASNVSGLSTAATTGSYNDLTDKPNAGGSTVPVYMNNGTATPLSTLNFNATKKVVTLHESDFQPTGEANIYQCEISIPYLSQITFTVYGETYVSVPWIWYMNTNDTTDTVYGFSGEQIIDGVQETFDCWYDHPYLKTYKDSWPQDWELKLEYIEAPDILSKEIKLQDNDTQCYAVLRPDTLLFRSTQSNIHNRTYISYESVRTGFISTDNIDISWDNIKLKTQWGAQPYIQIGETVLDEEKLKKLLALAENTNNIYMPVLGLVE